MKTPEQIDHLILDRVTEGRFSVHRDVLRDPELFELEMRYIFEGTWIFLGLASQAAAAHDFVTTWIGRNPVIISRDAQGKLHALLNTCRHRGAAVCPQARGNAKHFVCPYHGWAYDSAGRNIDIKDHKDGAYSRAFEEENHDLTPLPRFAEYRGLLFGALTTAVPSLEEHLGETRAFLDLLLDQSPQGIEIVPGVSTYTFKGNWKLQLENGLDAYHLTSTHPSFVKIVGRRRSGESGYRLPAVDFAQQRLRGGFTFDYGHAAVWSRNSTPEVRPLYATLAEVTERVGEVRARWMLDSRNLALFPNAQLVDNASMQLRVIRPLAVDLTEMKSYCIAPVGESAAVRESRLRQFEDFFNSSGLATPDDTSCYEACQTGHGARIVEWQQGYSRGMLAAHIGANETAANLGIHPVASQTGPHELQDEQVFHAAYREWRRLMMDGAARANAIACAMPPMRQAL